MTRPSIQRLVLSTDDGEFPVPLGLRSTISRIVEAFAAGDFQLRDHQVDGVLPISAEIANQMAGYVRDYGDLLAALDEAVWETSIYCWTGSSWDILVDLSTSRETVSDLVLFLGISAETQMMEVRSVHVP